MTLGCQLQLQFTDSDLWATGQPRAWHSGNVLVSVAASDASSHTYSSLHNRRHNLASYRVLTWKPGADRLRDYSVTV